jgi:hypothetical protein
MIEGRMLGKAVSGANTVVVVAKISGLFLLLARNFAMKYILFVLSFIVPKSKKVLFFSSVGGYRFPIWKNDETFQFKENPKYLAIYCAKKLKDFVPVFHIPNRKQFGQIEKLGITAGQISVCGQQQLFQSKRIVPRGQLPNNTVLAWHTYKKYGKRKNTEYVEKTCGNIHEV